MISFFWAVSRGNRFTPWRSPYLRWRIETYTGIPAHNVNFYPFWTFLWREKRSLLRYLFWVNRMRGN
jgi:hypothetical protein